MSELGQPAVFLGLGLVDAVSFDKLFESREILTPEQRPVNAEKFAIFVVLVLLVALLKYPLFLVELQREVLDVFEQIGHSLAFDRGHLVCISSRLESLLYFAVFTQLRGVVLLSQLQELSVLLSQDNCRVEFEAFDRLVKG